jgi:hypothetical protein
MRNHLRTALVALTLATLAACSDSQTPVAVEGPEPAPDPVAGPPRMTCLDRELAGRILVDASRDGGVWWSPQTGTFDPGAAHQGEQLAAYLRGRGFIVDELPRGSIVSDTLLSTYQGVIRAGQYGSYTTGELEGYDWFLDCGRTLILLGEFLQDGGRDGLAELFLGDVNEVELVPQPVVDNLIRWGFE